MIGLVIAILVIVVLQLLVLLSIYGRIDTFMKVARETPTDRIYGRIEV